MAFKVKRNSDGNCINFEGASQPTYWNACLSAEVVQASPDLINVINDIQSKNLTDGTKFYEFFNIHYSEFTDADGVAFGSAAAAATYINDIGNVLFSDSIPTIYVQSSAATQFPTGSQDLPFNNLADGIAAATAGDTISIEGDFVITAPIVLPDNMSLTFIGKTGTKVRYATFLNTNGNVFERTSLAQTGTLTFQNIEFHNGQYGIFVRSADEVLVDNCFFRNNGWTGDGLLTLDAETVNDVGYDSSQVDLQAFYAGNDTSNGGACRLENTAIVTVKDCVAEYNFRGIRLQDCGIGGQGVITRNTTHNNVETGIYLGAATPNAGSGCENFRVFDNSSTENANNGMLMIGGQNNILSRNVVKRNWNGGATIQHASDSRLRNLDMADNNRSAFNGIGNNADATAAIDISGDSIRNSAGFIIDVLGCQVHNTTLAAATTRVGLHIDSTISNINDKTRCLINIDNVGFHKHDYAIENTADLDSVRLTLGDLRYTDTAIQNVSQLGSGHWYEMAYSNQHTNAVSLDASIDETATTIILKESDTGTLFNNYPVNTIQAYADGLTVGIIQSSSDRIQISNIDPTNVTIDGTAPVDQTLANVVNVLNGLFTQTGGGTPSALAPDLTAQSFDADETDPINYTMVLDPGSDLVTMWSFTNLPAWLVASQTSGQLLGTAPAYAGTPSSGTPDQYVVSVSAANPHGITTVNLTINVYEVTFSAGTKSIYYDGSNDYSACNAAMGASFPLARASNGSGAGDSWSVSSVVRRNDTGNGKKYFWGYGEPEKSSGGVGCGHQAKDFFFRYGGKDAKLEFKSQGDEFDNLNWYHITVTYDGGTTGSNSANLQDYYQRFKIYVKDLAVAGTTWELTGNGSASGNNRNTSWTDDDAIGQTGVWTMKNDGWSAGLADNEFNSGTERATNKEWKGWIYRQCIYDGVLTAAEVATLGNMTLDPTAQSLGTASITHAWVMGDGPNDAYPNLRNQVNESSTADYDLLTMFNMNSGDIVNLAP